MRKYITPVCGSVAAVSQLALGGAWTKALGAYLIVSGFVGLILLMFSMPKVELNTERLLVAAERAVQQIHELADQEDERNE